MSIFNRVGLLLALLCAVLCLPIMALAQSQDAQAEQSGSQNSSVAEAARRNRDKKKNASSSRKVISDDDLDRRTRQPGPGGVNVGAAPKMETEPPTPQAVAAAETADNAAAQTPSKEADAEDQKIAQLKLQITEAEKDADLARRQFALDQDSFLAQTDYAHDTAGKTKLDGEKQLLNDKQENVERLRTQLAALEELKGRRKPNSTPAAPPSQPENPPQTPPRAPPQS